MQTSFGPVKQLSLMTLRLYFCWPEMTNAGGLFQPARAVLEVTPEVRLLRVTKEARVTNEMLEAATKIPEALLDIAEDDFASLSDIETVPQIHPAQDYFDSTLYMGTRINGSAAPGHHTRRQRSQAQCYGGGNRQGRLTYTTDSYSYGD